MATGFGRQSGHSAGSRALGVGLAWVALLLAGCAHAPTGPVLAPSADAPRWPPPPAAARVRFVGAIDSAADLKAPVGLWQRLVGDEPAEKLISPTDVAVADDGTLYVLDTDVRGVHRYDLQQRRYELLGIDTLKLPSALSWGDGRLFVTDAEAQAVFTWSPGAGWQRFDREPPQKPAGVVCVTSLGRVFVSDLLARGVRVYDLQGQQVGRIDTTTAGVSTPTHLAYHPDVGLAVSDPFGGFVGCFTPDGTPKQPIGSPGDAPGNLALPKGIAFDRAGHLYVVDARFENVQLFDTEGRVLMHFGQEGIGNGEFWLPAGLCIDDHDRIWVADTYNCRVQVFDFLGAASHEEPSLADNR